MKREDIPTPICDASADSIVGEPGLISYETGQELERDRAELIEELKYMVNKCQLYGGPKGGKMDLSTARALLERMK
jgi:hypothetical protein